MKEILTKADVAQRALEIFLGGMEASYIIEVMARAKEIWMKEDPTGTSLEKDAPIILLSGALLYRTTGILVLTEDTAEVWLKECSEMVKRSERIVGNA